MKRFDNEIFIDLKQALSSLDQLDFAQFNAAITKIMNFHQPQSELINILKAIEFLSACQYDAFNASTLWCSLSPSEQALVQAGMLRCKELVELRGCPFIQKE